MALPVKLMEGPEEVFCPNEGKELLIYFPKIIYLYIKMTQSVFRLYLQYYSMTNCLSSYKLSLHLNVVVENLISIQKNTKWLKRHKDYAAEENNYY